MTPSPKAIELATEKVEYVHEKDGQHIVKIFGTRYKYDDSMSAIQAKERLIAMLAETLESYAADVQALNSWDPRHTIGQA